MQTVLIVFMVFAALVCLFAIAVILRDVVIEILERRKSGKSAVQDEAIRPQVVVTTVAAPVEPVKAEEPAVTATEEAEETAATDAALPDGNVVFSAGTQQTLEEKYLELNAEERGYYDEIVKYAANVEDAKRFKNTNYEEYKIGNNRIVRLTIKRGVIHCEFMIPNSSFQTVVSESKVRIKQSATVVKVTNAEVVQVVKAGIDVAVKAVADEKERKKQAIKERRRQNRLAAKQNGGEAENK